MRPRVDDLLTVTIGGVNINQIAVGFKASKPVISKVGNHRVFLSQNKISHRLALLKIFENIIKKSRKCAKMYEKEKRTKLFFLSHLL